MSKIAVITLTTAGLGTGPFNIYSNVDTYVTPIVINITRAQLLAGYTCTVVPNAATILRVKNVITNVVCTNYIDITLT